ncbi:unnamed protein product [Polarella glacialis]|uniref:Uncharacterized protein n=1 Tax=Polarella glacialis TaxID=89957 RepID=A0A813HI86_POLGL|nr:unnamed protein product [Polarella glacialis]
MRNKGWRLKHEEIVIENMMYHCKPCKKEAPWYEVFYTHLDTKNHVKAMKGQGLPDPPTEPTAEELKSWSDLLRPYCADEPVESGSGSAERTVVLLEARPGQPSTAEAEASSQSRSRSRHRSSAKLLTRSEAKAQTQVVLRQARESAAEATDSKRPRNTKKGRNLAGHRSRSRRRAARSPKRPRSRRRRRDGSKSRSADRRRRRLPATPEKEVHATPSVAFAPPQEEAVEHLVEVDAQDIRFTQDSIGSKFSDGKTFELLISELRSGKAHPARSEFLKLRAVCTRLNGVHTYFSRDNRRLHCLKEYRKEIGKPLKVILKVKQHESLANVIASIVQDSLTQDVVRALSTKNKGDSVQVRGQPIKQQQQVFKKMQQDVQALRRNLGQGNKQY